jgi:phosphoenolpyruvate carboxykinase (GTP)
VFLGSTMGSETTAAATGTIGQLRRDPFAMLPFCGFNMGDYFDYWLKLGRDHDPSKLPRVFRVNWFRKDRKGRWLWPGYAENSRVIEWIFRRLDGAGQARRTPIGYVPTRDALNVDGLKITREAVEELLRVDPHAWLEEVPMLHDNYLSFGDHLPAELAAQLEALKERLHAASS